MYVYLVKFAGRDAVKIGKTSRLKTRHRELAQVHGAVEWCEVCKAGDGARHLEEFLHKKFKPFNVKGLPECDGYTEFYDSSIANKVKMILRCIDDSPREKNKRTPGGMYKRSDSANWQWHVKTPKDLQHVYNKVWAHSESLKTPSRELAEVMSDELGAKWEEIFNGHRRDSVALA